MSSAARTVLVSGASIAGPALAYWLCRYGFDVTVVEQASALRGGGFAIDVRGTAMDVATRMGLAPQLQRAHVDTRKITFLDVDGSAIATIRPETITGGVAGRDVEVSRGDLADALYGLVRDDIEFVFNDSIAALDEHDSGVDVTFRNMPPRTFNLVIGADGLHSNTRALVFGSEAQFHRYLGHCFAGFTLPNHLGLAHEGFTWNAPGRTAVLYAPGDTDRLHGFLSFLQPEPPVDAFRDPQAQRDLVASAFAEFGWEIPCLVEAMRSAEDLYFDVVSQVHMSRWSSGRIALVGDAAYAPSFFSGQGSSVALVGAYLLAGELATDADHRVAFGRYESRAREFVEMNQALATAGAATVSPRTPEALEERNEALRNPELLSVGAAGREANTQITLPDYAPDSRR